VFLACDFFCTAKGILNVILAIDGKNLGKSRISILEIKCPSMFLDFLIWKKVKVWKGLSGIVSRDRVRKKSGKIPFMGEMHLEILATPSYKRFSM